MSVQLKFSLVQQRCRLRGVTHVGNVAGVPAESSRRAAIEIEGDVLDGMIEIEADVVRRLVSAGRCHGLRASILSLVNKILVRYLRNDVSCGISPRSDCNLSFLRVKNRPPFSLWLVLWRTSADIPIPAVITMLAVSLRKLKGRPGFRVSPQREVLPILVELTSGVLFRPALAVLIERRRSSVSR